MDNQKENSKNVQRSILFSPPDISDLEIAEVVEALKSGWITTGPRTKELEKRLAEFCHTPKVVCLNSATAAEELNFRICSNNYGPYQFPEKLIPLMINNVSQNKKLPVYGEGLNVRDWLYVKDHCYGILAVLEKGKVGEVYNLGGHNEKANIEIVKIILNELGKSEDLITYVEDRKGHDQRYAIDPSKANKELGWGPTTMFADGIKLTIQWYKEHMDWMEECTSGEYMNYYKEMYGNR